MEAILSEFLQAHAFIDDIFVVTKGSEIEHISAVEKISRKLNSKNMSIKLKKWKFAQKECEWFGQKITPTGVTPLIRETEQIETLKPPRTASQLASFMVSIRSLHKYLPALAEFSAPLRHLLGRKKEYIWTHESQTSSNKLMKQVANIVQLRQFHMHRDTRRV